METRRENVQMQELLSLTAARILFARLGYFEDLSCFHIISIILLLGGNIVVAKLELEPIAMQAKSLTTILLLFQEFYLSKFIEIVAKDFMLKVFYWMKWLPLGQIPLDIIFKVNN